ncbi:hypothetical protein LTR02_006879 [Friedmanniomyces endolithicus]|nr:hypothetical protein LTR94_014130 [Friedmanniomyces endolithicus]KAK0779879.1 hypothetical protein LTR59_013002 [Friedmanniomyces endolithicus]KAK0784372.1 hypothetical protein LTR38_012717 [Friedmanniomyces endolithicus]KAK0794718.1 hypothetical protein LTR75_010743 [Friedmanniomyces endolithicus]KAK0829616.1 hypothetical protein LTR03_016153 [Friedmanniomyces endolithicus]
MAHQQIAEYYARQRHLKDILARRDHMQAVQDGMNKRRNKFGSMHEQPTAAELRIRELELAITGHQDQLKAKQNDADAMAKELQEQRAISKEVREDSVLTLSDLKRVLRDQRFGITRIHGLGANHAEKDQYPIVHGRTGAPDLGSKNLRAEISRLQIQLATAKDGHDATKVELIASKEERASLRCRVTKFAKLKNSLDTKVAALTREVDEVGRGYSDKEAEKRKVEGLLEREKKRRREAEAMLGPDGKRCKKCNPEIINLEQDAGLETTITQPDRVRQSHHHQEGVTSSTHLPPTASLDVIGAFLARLAHGPAREQVRPVPRSWRTNGDRQFDTGVAQRRLGP